MTEHQPDRIWSGIDIPKTLAGVLAALSAAVVGSYLGVAGTLAGAAVASLIGSVGTEVYTRSIKKGHRKLQGTFTAAPAAVGTPPVSAAATTIALPAMDASPRKVRWKRVALVAGALFVLAMGTLTVAELISGRSIADATRGGNGDRSTVSSLFGDKSGKSEKSRVSTPSQSPSTQPTTTESPTDRPTDEPTGGTSPAPTGNSDTVAPTTGSTGNPGSTGNGSGTGSGSGTGNNDTGTGTGTGGTGGGVSGTTGVTGSAQP
ncbi:hypothetical protein [Actinoplanes subtropicus]|uniref:hypothetical protein n=1 Tax=Actinoplanes subtropicus TaxID=543632 RepID=UPI0004C2B670|nr:hypothetical protein [Actinoplanes subtropicus]